MKSISIQQPWAHAITHGAKRVENRTWNGWYRGLLLIHAGKRYQTGMEAYINRDCPDHDIAGMLAAPRGAIVGVCRMVGCVAPVNSDTAPQGVAEDQVIWSDPYQYKFILDDVRAFAVPIPYKGALGFFDVPDEIYHQTLAEFKS
jgi:hypothetical protein